MGRVVGFSYIGSITQVIGVGHIAPFYASPKLLHGVTYIERGRGDGNILL